MPPELARDGVRCGTGSSHSAVSTLAFELRRVREFQKTSCYVRLENRQPNITITAELNPSQVLASVLKKALVSYIWQF